MSIVALSIGAGAEQCASIEKAQALGFHVVAIDGNPDACGLKIANSAVVLDIMQEDQVIQIARSKGVALILPQPVGKPLVTQGAVNDALNLRGVSRLAAVLCTDKDAFLSEFEPLGLRMPVRHACTGDHSLLSTAVGEWRFPVVLKPSVGSGSRGVRVIETADDWAPIVHNLSEADKALFQDGTLIQEFVTGEVLGVDGAIIDGKVQLVLVRRKGMSARPYRVEIYNEGPFPLADGDLAQLNDMIEQVRAGLEMQFGVFHADIILTPEREFVLIEFSARPSGMLLSEKLVKQATGVDFLTDAIRLMAFGAADFAPAHKCFVGLHFLTSGNGRLQVLPDVQTLLSEDGVVEARVNDALTAPRTVGEAMDPGYFIIKAETQNQLDATLMRVMKHINPGEK